MSRGVTMRRIHGSIHTLIFEPRFPKYFQTTDSYEPGGSEMFTLLAILTEFNQLPTFAGVIMWSLDKRNVYVMIFAIICEQNRRIVCHWCATNDVNGELKQAASQRS